MQTTIRCLMQNRLGSLDRVLGALTFRGIIPLNLEAAIDPTTGHMMATMTFEYDNEHSLEKLVKILNKQVTVIHAHVQNSNTDHVLESNAAQPVTFLTPSQASHQRRALNA